MVYFRHFICFTFILLNALFIFSCGVSAKDTETFIQYQEEFNHYNQTLDEARRVLNQNHLSDAEISFYITKIKRIEKTLEENIENLKTERNKYISSKEEIKLLGFDIDKTKKDKKNVLNEVVSKLDNNIEMSAELLIFNKILLDRSTETLSALTKSKLNLINHTLFNYNIPLYKTAAWVEGRKDIISALSAIIAEYEEFISELTGHDGKHFAPLKTYILLFLTVLLFLLYYLVKKILLNKTERNFHYFFAENKTVSTTYKNILFTRGFICIVLFIVKAVIPILLLFAIYQSLMPLFNTVHYNFELLSRLIYNLYTSLIFVICYHAMIDIILDRRMCFVSEKLAESKSFKLKCIIIVFQIALLFTLTDVNILDISIQHIKPILGLDGTALINFILSLTISYSILITVPMVLIGCKNTNKTNFSKLTKLITVSLVCCTIAMPLSIFFGASNFLSGFTLNILQTFGILCLFWTLYDFLNRVSQVVAKKIFHHFYKRSFDQIKEANLNIKEPETPILNYWIHFFLASALFFSMLLTLILVWGMPPDIVLNFIETLLFKGIPLGSDNYLFPLSNLFKAFFLCFLVYYFFKAVENIFERKILPFTSADTGSKKAILTTIGYIGIVLSVVIFVFSLGINLTALTFIVSGLSVGIGFALQEFIKNFFSGFVLLIERPFKIGDWLSYKGEIAEVRKIRIRSTEIITFNRVTMIVPNSELVNSTVINETASPVTRVEIKMAAAYSSIPDEVICILKKAIQITPDIFNTPAPVVQLADFADSAVLYSIKVFTNRTLKVKVASELRKNILIELVKAGMEIPFPKRTVYLKS